MNKQSVGVIGAGRLGSDVALALAERDLCDIVLYDIDQDRAHYLASDLSDTAFAHGYRPRVSSVPTMDGLAGCDVVMLAAGARMEPGMASDEVFEKNRELVQQIADSFVGSSTLFVVASEPIDLMTAELRRKLQIPSSRVLGIGGVIDSFRLRHALGSALELSPDSITGHLIGPASGEASILWEYTTISGMPASAVAGEALISDLEDVFAKQSEARLKRLTESFSRYATAAAAFDLLRAIIRDDRRVITVTMEWTNLLGISDVAMSVPAIIGRFGADRVEVPSLSDEVVSRLRSAAERLRTVLDRHVEHAS